MHDRFYDIDKNLNRLSVLNTKLKNYCDTLQVYNSECNCYHTFKRGGREKKIEEREIDVEGGGECWLWRYWRLEKQWVENLKKETEIIQKENKPR